MISIIIMAQPSQYIFNKITTDQGLSNNSIWCIYKDSRGFIWFGTADGLNRYDGYNFTVFKNNPSDPYSISDNFISSIVEDHQGNLWIGTQGGGLNRFDPVTERFTPFYHHKGDTNSLSADFIFHHNALSIDSENILWIGTANGFCSYHISEKYFRQYPLVLPEGEIVRNIRVVLQEGDTYLWLGTDRGLIRFNKMTREYKSYTHRETLATSLSSNIVTAIVHGVDSNDIWIGTEYGLNLFNKDNETFQRFYKDPWNPGCLSDNSISSLALDEEGDLWIGTKSGGLNEFKTSRDKFLNWKQNLSDETGISDDYIEYLLYDSSGYVWIGFANAGIDIIDISTKQFTHIRHQPNNPNSLSYNTIRSIYEDSQGYIWIGTYGGGLNKLNSANGDITRYLHDPDNRNTISHNIVSAINETERGELLVGTYGGGLNLLDLRTGDIERITSPLPEFILDIYRDSHGVTWIAGNGGLFTFNPVTGETKRFDSDNEESRQLTSNAVNSILEDFTGSFWVATWDGLNRVLSRSGKLERDTIIHIIKEPGDPNGLSDDRITCTFVDRNHYLWIGTYSGGLNKLDQIIDDTSRSYKFVHYTEDQGLSNNTVFGILEDDQGYLWLSTNFGLSRFNPVDESFYNFGKSDGLQDNQFYWGASFKSHTGNMYFGGINGMNVFHPDSIEISHIFPDLIISDFQLFNKSVTTKSKVNGRQVLERSILFTDGIELSHKDFAFSFEFNAITYVAQDKIEYAYRLLGFNEDWIFTDANRRYASYSNLRPGDYDFQVRSTNENGTWNDEMAHVFVTVLPAYWETKWAFLVYIVILLLLLYYFRNQVLTRARFRHDLKMERYEKQQLEEYNDMKLKFFTNISHEFRTPLTLIMGPLENILSSGNLDRRIKNQLLLVHRNSKRLLGLINQLMDFRKAESGNLILQVGKLDLIKFVKGIAALFRSKASQNRIDFKVVLHKKSAVLWFDANVVETIIYNLLSNAFKFTSDQGKIRLIITFLDQNNERVENELAEIHYIQIQVRDTGIGISKERIGLLFKRFYSIDKTEIQKRGTGIGLALCKDLAELHHGTIGVISEAGEGTSFSVTIPVHKSSFTEDEFAPVVSSVDTEADMTSSKEKDDDLFISEEFDKPPEFQEPEKRNAPVILIIEDDLEIIEYIGQILSSEYKIKYALNAAEGYNLASDIKPELIITDVMMPGMDGLELCNMLKSDIRTSHIPVIVLTALSTTEDRIKGLESGADSYIPKPFNPKHLQVRVEKLIEQRNRLRISFQSGFPDNSENATPTSTDEKFLKKVMEKVNNNISNSEYSVEDLAGEIGMSSTHLYRKLKALTGYSTNQLIRKTRLFKAAELINCNQGTISEIMYASGFTNPSYFAKCFHEEFKVTPKEMLANSNKKGKSHLSS